MGAHESRSVHTQKIKLLLRIAVLKGVCDRLGIFHAGRQVQMVFEVYVLHATEPERSGVRFLPMHVCVCVSIGFFFFFFCPPCVYVRVCSCVYCVPTCRVSRLAG